MCLHGTWTLLSSVAIAATFVCVIVFFGTNGALFLSSYLVSILNYEMSWYSYAIIQTLLRPFQLYFEMDVLAPYRDTRKATTVADSWGARAGISASVMTVIVSALVMLLSSGFVAVLQLFANLWPSTSTFFLILAYVASTSFVAVVCAMLTPTPMDGVILLLQQFSFSMYSLNSFFDFRESVDNTVRQFVLIEGGYSIAVTFVPIVILRILRSTEIARTGLTLLLDLFCLQYIPSLLMLFGAMVDQLLQPDINPVTGIPDQGLFVVVSCFLVLWTTDLTTALLPSPSQPGSSWVKQWTVVLVGIVASILANVVVKVGIAPAEIPLLEWYHIVLMVLGSCLYHVGATFATLLRSLAKHDASLRTKWLVRVHYFLLLGFFLAVYERVEWSSAYSTTLNADIAHLVQKWQRLDNVSYNEYQDSQNRYDFLASVVRIFQNVNMPYTPDELSGMFVLTTQRFLVDVGTCIVESMEANVTGKECFSGFPNL
ncbi:hypothetical protein DYB32_000448 [Aphanomyces invadans]|uniref:Uncharacterized protein n=1 Tax=Aphanomyces invadans TaxID=157072 RepID=A0A3R6WTX6_9STRA|nr:hypothetical protein DYB32_000448 [Aphanomyces invadans]